MSEPRDHDGARPGSARVFLTALATLAAAGAVVRSAAAEDAALDALIGDTERGPVRPSFDQGWRTIHPAEGVGADALALAATLQTTEKAIETYDAILSRGGWAVVPKVDQLRLGDRHPSVASLRSRLSASGDLDGSAVGNDMNDSDVEAAVRRFQARHGLTVDGILRPATLLAMNVPAATRRDQLKVNIERLKALTAIPARATWSATSRQRASRRSRTTSRYRGTPPSSASPIAPRPTSTARSSKSTSTRIGPAYRRRSCARI